MPGRLHREWRKRLKVSNVHEQVSRAWVKQKRLLPLYQPVLNQLFKRARRIIVGSSDYMASSPFLSQYADRAVIVPYGVDAGRVTLQAGDADAKGDGIATRVPGSPRKRSSRATA